MFTTRIILSVSVINTLIKLNEINKLYWRYEIEPYKDFFNIEQDYDINISEVWSVGSSGTLTRGLQMAFPDKDVHVVSVGHSMKQNEVGRAILHRSDLKFTQEVKEEDTPPFPSVPTYDAKAWKIIREHAKPGALFWNVGA